MRYIAAYDKLHTMQRNEIHNTGGIEE